MWGSRIISQRKSIYETLTVFLLNRKPSAKFENSITLTEDRLFLDVNMKMKFSSLNNERVLLVGFNCTAGQAMCDFLTSVGVPSVATRTDLETLCSYNELVAEFSVIVVNFDGFADTHIGIEMLMSFRAVSHRCAVMLCSSTVNDDDLTSERAAICDATMRLPSTPVRLRLALLAALENRFVDPHLDLSRLYV